MLGDQGRFDPFGQFMHALQMLLGKSLRRADAHADPVHADRIILAQLFQYVGIPAAGIEIVFAMDFQPVDLWPMFEKFAVMRCAQPDADSQPRRR